MLQEVYQPKKVFSLREANRTLPLVSRIIRDIVRANAELAEAGKQARVFAAAGQPARAQEMEDRAQDLGGEIQDYVEELEKIGCVCKDPFRGLVDFPARAGDRIVLLCWQMGESEILFYHEVEAGFAGRKPVCGVFDRG